MALMSLRLVHCNPVHHQTDENLWVVMSGVVKLEKPTSMKLCGKRLTEVLSLVCHGHYNKRSSFLNRFHSNGPQTIGSDMGEGLLHCHCCNFNV